MLQPPPLTIRKVDNMADTTKHSDSSQPEATKPLPPTRRYSKTTRERLIALVESIGWSVRNASTDGSWKRFHLPNGTFSGYWLYGDSDVRIEHRIDDFRGGVTFYLKDCFFESDGSTVSIVGKENKSLFISFHNFDTHTKRNDLQPSDSETKLRPSKAQQRGLGR